MQSGLLLKYWGLAPCWCTMHSFQQSCLYQEAFPWPLQYSLNQDANYWPTRAGQGAVMLTKSGLAGKPSGRGACIWKPLRRHGGVDVDSEHVKLRVSGGKMGKIRSRASHAWMGPSTGLLWCFWVCLKCRRVVCQIFLTSFQSQAFPQIPGCSYYDVKSFCSFFGYCL